MTSTVHEFPCPHCSTTLRLRDKKLRNRTTDCPACKKSVLIKETDQGLSASVPELQVSNDALPYPETKISPLIIVSVLAAITVLGWLIFHSNSQPAPATPPQEPVAVPAETPVQGLPQEETNPSEAEQAPTDPVTDSLNKINILISKHLAKHHAYPMGVVKSDQALEDRFSWIAQLESEFGNEAGIVDWDKSWQAPVNDRFVRRRLSAFQNAALKKSVGDDQLPATHFVGISGYGEQAATLPANHPRAGIFGIERQTTEADIIDGLANTMLIAGVSEELGSWARSGNATMRAFTQQPYINGPDGFGTGSPNGMQVLMADGSVKFLNQNTDPVILERMAAMADGLPLDPTVVHHKPVAVEQAAKPGPDEMPILVPIAPDVPPFDLNVHLQNKILSYQQPKPTPVGIVLQDVEELIGVPLDRTQLTEDQLAERITVDQMDITLNDLLATVLKSAGLRYELQAQSILIIAP